MCVAGASPHKQAKRISITLDDAPMSPTRLFRFPYLRALSLLDGIRANQEEFKLGVFVVGSHIKKFGFKDISIYDSAGHVISNHSFSHPALSKTTVEDFVADVVLNHDLISNFRSFQPFFRFPYLDKGGGKHKQVLKSLALQGYTDGYVTVLTHDWYINKLLIDAVNNEEFIDYRKFGRWYVDVIVSGAEFMFEQYSQKGLEQPAHILLLHANDVNALYFDLLIDAFKKKGWLFVSMDKAYKENHKLYLSGRFNMRSNFKLSLGSPYIDISYIQDSFDKAKVKFR